MPPKDQPTFILRQLLTAKHRRLKGAADNVLSLKNGTTEAQALKAAGKIGSIRRMHPKAVAALHNHVIVKPNGMAAVNLESLPTVVDLAVRMRAVTVRSLGFESCALPPTAPFHPLTRAALLSLAPPCSRHRRG